MFSTGSPLDGKGGLAAALVATAAAIVVSLTCAAVAHDDAGVHGFSAANGAGYAATNAAQLSGPDHVLTITPRHASSARLARHAAPHGPVVATSGPGQPTKPLVTVSIYADTTLRRGDAVMTGKGLRIFDGSRTFPYRPADFTALAMTRSLDRSARKALVDYDQNPKLRRQG